MWSDSIVVNPSLFNDDLSFRQGVEDFTIEKFISEASIEALTISVIPLIL